MENYVDLFKLLVIVSTCDGIVSCEEKKELVKIGSCYGILENDVEKYLENAINGNITLETVSNNLTEENKEEIINEMLKQCHIDGDYSDKEKEGIRIISRSLSISNERITELENRYESEKDSAIADIKEGMKFLGKGITNAISFGKKKKEEIEKVIVNNGVEYAHVFASEVGKLGAKMAEAIDIAKKAKEENELLRKQLESSTLAETVKQKIILQLNDKIISLTSQLEKEKERNQKNAEMIQLLQEQIDDLIQTRSVAESAECEG